MRRFACVPLLALALAPACGAPPAEPSAQLLAVHGETLVRVDTDGLVPLLRGLPPDILITDVRASLDNSRVVAFGPPRDGGDRWRVLARRENGWDEIDRGVDVVAASDDARWIWTEAGRFEPDRGVRLFRYDGTFVMSAALPLEELHLPAFGPDDAYVIVRERSEARLFHLDGRETRFDPALGTDWDVRAVREDAILLGNFGTAGTWFSLDGEVLGAESELAGVGYTLREGELTWRFHGLETTVATGLPAEVGEILASDSGMVSARYAGLDWYRTTGERVATLSIPPYDGELVPLGARVSDVHVRDAVATDARNGVVLANHVGTFVGGDVVETIVQTVHAYTVDDAGVVTLTTLGEYPAGALSEDGLATHPGSARVAWFDRSARTVVDHDVETGGTRDLDAGEDVAFALYWGETERHR
jgi:hypothetical protein